MGFLGIGKKVFSISSFILLLRTKMHGWSLAIMNHEDKGHDRTPYPRVIPGILKILKKNSHADLNCLPLLLVERIMNIYLV